MKSNEILREYIWLLNTVASSQPISLAEINERWCQTPMSGGLGFSRTTFYRHRKDIQQIFGVTIECDQSNGNRYYIDDIESMNSKGISRWVVSNLTVGSMLSRNSELTKRIIVDDTPSNNDNLDTILTAMRLSQVMRITYRRYTDQEPKEHLVEPYCLKLFRQRCYMLCHTSNDHMTLFSLDRIVDLSLTDDTFEIDPNFNAATYFDHYFGVMVNHQPAEIIKLRAYGWEQHSMIDLPLHQSQQVIDKTEQYTDFILYLVPTPDFIAHLLSKGRWLRVLQPQWIADEIAQQHADAAEIYKKQKTLL